MLILLAFPTHTRPYRLSVRTQDFQSWKLGSTPSRVKNFMRILAIETSCDETAICVLECEGGLAKPHFKVIANALHSQIELHKEYGGVYPMLAKREHQKNLPLLLEQIGDATRDVDL